MWVEIRMGIIKHSRGINQFCNRATYLLYIISAFFSWQGLANGICQSLQICSRRNHHAFNLTCYFFFHLLLRLIQEGMG